MFSGSLGVLLLQSSDEPEGIGKGRRPLRRVSALRSGGSLAQAFSTKKKGPRRNQKNGEKSKKRGRGGAREIDNGRSNNSPKTEDQQRYKLLNTRKYVGKEKKEERFTYNTHNNEDDRSVASCTKLRETRREGQRRRLADLT